MDKLLSIVMATYNSEASLVKALDSILLDKPIWLELIVKDGGSTDSTLQILEKYREKIDCLISENDISLYEALNVGTQFSSGKYLFYMGSDDFLLPQALKKILPLLLKNEESLLALPVLINGKYKKKPDISLPVPILHHQGAIFNRMLVKQLKGYSTAFHVHSDFDLMARYTSQYGLNYIDIPICSFSSGGLSNSGTRAFSSLREVHVIYWENGGRFFSRKWVKFTVRIIYYFVRSIF